MLELPLLLERVASLAASEAGRARVRALRPSSQRATVERRLRRLAQLRAILAESPPPAIEGLDQAAPLHGRLAAAGALLLPAELALMLDFLQATGAAASFLAPSLEDYDELGRLANRLTPLPQVARELGRVIGPGGSVASEASPELARLRRQTARAREGLSSQLKELMSQKGASLFSDQLVTQRADRFVVPVRQEAKGRVPGIIHDTSGSGATCFVEPLEAVESNNRLALLRRQEREEEERVLRQATALLAGQRQVLGENLAALAQLDCLLAQAEFCRRLDCSAPVLSPGDELELRGARHPLLAWRQSQGQGRAVPIKVRAGGRGAPVLVISGANAGGKTATLKTVGLIALMVMCGLQAPLDAGSRLPVFGRVLAEVGDEQDLSRQLSTFTAHAGRLAQMVRASGKGTLVLIDEIGAGTDPEEGAALAMSVLGWLHRRSALVLCTTHFHRLKAFAAATGGVENVSVAFDKKSGQPTFQLHYGLPGFSDALMVSTRLGFPGQVIEEARGYIDQGHGQMVALLRQAEEARQQALAELSAAQSDRLAAAEERRQAKLLFERARQERGAAAGEGKRRVRRVARALEERLDELYQRAEESLAAGDPLKPGQVRQELYAQRRQALARIAELAEAGRPQKRGVSPQVRALKEGDPVRLTVLGQNGVLAQDPGPGEDSVAVLVGPSGVRVLVPLSEMEPLAPGSAPRPEAGVRVSAAGDEAMDLNLVGWRVAEAEGELDKALDRAALAGRGELRIIHGRGTGRLREGLRRFLSRHPLVATVRPGEKEGQGNAVTIAELR